MFCAFEHCSLQEEFICTIPSFQIADEVLAMQIPMKPDKIQELADKINNAVASLTDIDRILAETADSRKIAEDLKKQAESAS